MKKSQNFPNFLEIETTTKCPINPPCIMCIRSEIKKLGIKEQKSNNFREREISTNLIKKLLPVLKNVNFLGLNGVGEPLLCKKLFKIISLTNPNAKTFFYSNGILLNDKMIKKILASNIYYISFSLDAASKKTYAKIRTDSFDKVINNVSNLIKERNKQKKLNPLVYINMNLMKENYREASKIILLAKRIGAEGVMLWPIIDNGIIENKRKNFHFKILEQKTSTITNQLKKEIKKAKKLAEKNNILLEYSLEEKKEIQKIQKECKKPWNHALVTLNGEVRFCCFSSEFLGNLNNQSFEKIWNGKNAQDIRFQFKKGIVPKSCLCVKALPIDKIEKPEQKINYKNLIQELRGDFFIRYVNNPNKINNIIFKIMNFIDKEFGIIGETIKIKSPRLYRFTKRLFFISPYYNSR